MFEREKGEEREGERYRGVSERERRSKIIEVTSKGKPIEKKSFRIQNNQ